MEKTKSFFEPIITALGLISSLAVSLAPIFSQTKIDTFFIDQKLVVPASTLAFLLSTIAIWIGLTQPYLRLPFFNSEPLRSISNKINDLLNNISFLGFLIIGILLWIFAQFISVSATKNHDLAIYQAVLYIIFFVLVSYLFAVLFGLSKSKYDFDQTKKERPNAIRTLLENHGLIPNNFRIEAIGSPNMMTRIVHIKIERLSKQDLYVLINNDSTEFYQILTKQQGEDFFNPHKQNG